MGLCIPVLRAIKRKGFQLPTPIQRKTIPLILQGIDVVGMARTGSGKTAAFTIPIIEKLQAHKANSGVRAVFLAPTRELALQTFKVIKEIGKYSDLRTAVLVGGDSMEAQFAELATYPDVIVATPGRLLHHLEEIPGFNLKNLQHAVLDEADRLFEMGLGEQVKEILQKSSENRQTLLFSATMPAAVAEFARAGLRTPELIRLDADTKLSPDLSLAFFTMRQSDKPAALLQLVQEILPADSPTIVFTATKHRVEYLAMLFEQEGIDCSAIYGAMDQTARKISVARFRNGKVKLMIVTDVAARGIDIPLLDNVINYDFTAKPKLFVHRAGRAARAGRTGTAYSFLTTDELPYLIDLHLFLSRPLQVVPEDGGDSQQVKYDDQSVSWIGKYPEAMLDMPIEAVREAVALNPSIQSLERSCENAFSLYVKTRPAASKESVKRARALGRPGPHPLLMRTGEKRKFVDLDAEAARTAFTAALKRFRPAATVLEAQVAAGRRGDGAGHAAVPGVRAAGMHERKLEVMRQKRQAHAVTIQRHYDEAENRAAAQAATHSMAGNAEKNRDDVAAAWQTAEIGSGRFCDNEFFIPMERSGRHADDGYSLGDSGRQAIDAAVMDMNAEDADGLSQQRRRTVWDNKKKRYVQLQANETIKAGKRVKVDTGKKDKSDGKTGEIYKKWVKRVGRKVGDSIGKDAKGGASALADRFKYGGRGWKNPLAIKRANAGIVDDTKNEGQLRKEAKKKQRQKEHLQSKAAVKKKQGKKRR